ncbi:MAG: hypothetical protein A2W35_21425 [Chloroflexi bacterium RBG_16_57_11]|nr:MAG: hypothetical protein A2W35_21425 [Chloroflexi bacterium RBG_16_57_11]
MDDEIEITKTSTFSKLPVLTWRSKAMLIGGVVGAAVGVTAAYMLAQRSKDDQPPKMSVGEGVKIGVLVFSLLRSIANL